MSRDVTIAKAIAVGKRDRDRGKQCAPYKSRELSSLQEGEVVVVELVRYYRQGWNEQNNRLNFGNEAAL